MDSSKQLTRKKERKKDRKKERKKEMIDDNNYCLFLTWIKTEKDVMHFISFMCNIR